jgi:hypothetical protein
MKIAKRALSQGALFKNGAGFFPVKNWIVQIKRQVGLQLTDILPTEVEM